MEQDHREKARGQAEVRGSAAIKTIKIITTGEDQGQGRGRGNNN